VGKNSSGYLARLARKIRVCAPATSLAHSFGDVQRGEGFARKKSVQKCGRIILVSGRGRSSYIHGGDKRNVQHLSLIKCKVKLIPIEACILNFEIAPFKRRTEPRTLNLKPRPFNLNLQYMTMGKLDL
jgi:hypothetical protein